MADEPRAPSNGFNVSTESQATFAMWVTGLALLPLGLLVFFARRFLRRVRNLVRDN